MWWQARYEVQILSALKAFNFVLILSLFLSIFAETCVAIAHSEDPIHGEEFPVVQPQWILEIRKTTIVKGFNALEEEFDLQRRNRRDEIDNEKARLLKKLQKPAKKTDYTKGHLRYRLLSAIDGFQRFGKIAETGIQRKRESYRKLTHWQKQTVDRIADYHKKLEDASSAIQQNAELAEEVANHAMQYYGIGPSEVSAFSKELDKSGESSDHTSVSQALKHIVRDWADDGIDERRAVFPQILGTLLDLFPERQNSTIRVLIPGSGLGRLAHEVADLGGFHVISNEWSTYMNLAYRYIASLKKVKEESLYPYVDSWSHQPTTEELQREVHFPDLIASPDGLIHVEGDFTTEFKRHDKFDVIVTLFFIDTARNLLHYFETIRDLLKPGVGGDYTAREKSEGERGEVWIESKGTDEELIYGSVLGGNDTKTNRVISNNTKDSL
ncbi:hypothetical protein V496_08987 [Pseudogymnoascus sp. VKM F-4515 (FW-2607)]|nr:hypothetical protein V496_08987 [Pseudogymnoascus sp. VKM F-4515 (FW-2607)]KFY76235.1 hypothetical protein V498_09715 [Pseudogymnoascus sp. VKM F-4517 (FW-2822)]